MSSGRQPVSPLRPLSAAANQSAADVLSGSMTGEVSDWAQSASSLREGGAFWPGRPERERSHHEDSLQSFL